MFRKTAAAQLEHQSCQGWGARSIMLVWRHRFHHEFVQLLDVSQQNAILRTGLLPLRIAQALDYSPGLEDVSAFALMGVFWRDPALGACVVWDLDYIITVRLVDAIVELAQFDDGILLAAVCLEEDAVDGDVTVQDWSPLDLALVRIFFVHFLDVLDPAVDEAQGFDQVLEYVPRKGGWDLPAALVRHIVLEMVEASIVAVLQDDVPMGVAKERFHVALDIYVADVAKDPDFTEPTTRPEAADQMFVESLADKDPVILLPLDETVFSVISVVDRFHHEILVRRFQTTQADVFPLGWIVILHCGLHCLGFFRP